jgi:hypothetical protein
VLRAQTSAALERIRDAVGRELARYRRGSALEIPMSAVMASATRPATRDSSRSSA